MLLARGFRRKTPIVSEPACSDKCASNGEHAVLQERVLPVIGEAIHGPDLMYQRRTSQQTGGVVAQARDERQLIVLRFIMRQSLHRCPAACAKPIPPRWVPIL